MIGLPHRVGAAYVVLGQANGTEPRVGHILNSNAYGGGSPAQYHTYFGNYPETTTPDYIITKVAGTLGEDYTYTSASSNTIPGNILKLVSYKTELNHYIPTYAASADSNIPSYDSEGIWTTDPSPPPGNSGHYIPDSWLYDYTGDNVEYEYIDTLPQFTSFISGLKASWTHFTDVTNNIDGDVEGFTSSTFYPRWNAESEYEQTGLLEPPISVTIEDDPTFYQTREGPAMTPPEDQSGTNWICPWTVGRVPESGLNQRLKIDQNVSYKFTKAGSHTDSSVAWKIVYPWGKGAYYPSTNTYVPPPFGNTRIADESPRLKSYSTSGQYGDKIIASSYRTTICTVYPTLIGEEFAYVNYQNTSTHGLFLAANGSCWNIGTELKVKVHIWKCPPRFCLYYRNKDKDGGGYPYDNWRRGLEATLTAVYDGGEPYVMPRIIGPATGTFNDGDFRFEGGADSGVDYSIPEPKAIHLHYWGTVFAPDTDSELNVEHEVLEFTITIGEDNTYTCNGDPREGVEMTPFGFKLEDIELEPIEGYITYIKDFEVTSITKPPATPP
jgi:hypothetical protein